MGAAALNKVLVVDDAESVCLAISMMLQKHNLDVSTALTYMEAITRVRRDDFDLVVIDAYLGSHSGLDLAEEILKQKPETRLLIMSGSVLLEDEVKARPRLQRVPIVHKPFTRNELIECIRKAVDKAA
jgi:DNA-binding NtrC family response regulator